MQLQTVLTLTQLLKPPTYKTATYYLLSINLLDAYHLLITCHLPASDLKKQVTSKSPSLYFHLKNITHPPPIFPPFSALFGNNLGKYA